MRIHRVKFCNFGPFELREFNFERGLIGVFGPNGSGKSTLVGGIYAALTNDWSRFHGVKADNICSLAPSRARSFVELEAEHEGVSFTIVRQLRPNNSTLMIDGREITNSDDIERELTLRLGVDKRLVDTYVFVKQGEMHAFLSQTPQKRAEAFQRLCRTENATDIYRACGRALEKHKLPVLEDNSADLSTALVEVSQRVDELNKKASQLTKRLLNSVSEKSAKTIVKVYADALTAQEEVNVSQAHLGSIQAELLGLTNQINEAEKRVRVLETEAEAATDAMTRARAADAKAGEFKRYLAQLDTVKKKHDKLAEELRGRNGILAKVEPDIEVGYRSLFPDLTNELHRDRVIGIRVEEWSKRRGKLELDIANMADTAAMDHAAECPVCHQEISEEFIQSCRTRLVELRAEMATVCDRLQAWRNLCNLCSTRDVTRREAESYRKQISEAVLEYKSLQKKAPEKPSEPPASVAEAAIVWTRASNKLADARRVVTDLTHRSGVLSGKQQQIESRLTELYAVIAQKDSISDATVEKAKQRLKEHETANAELTLVKNELTIRASEQNRLTDQLQKLRDRKSSLERMELTLHKLTTVRDLFHWSALPKQVSQANLRRMQNEINRGLELFGSPFVTSAGEDLSLTIQKPGVPPHRAERASGGQRGILAIAFRIAVNKLFGTDVGLMVLDEPTEGLDADNLAMFRDALIQFGSQLQSDRQLVVISHVVDLAGAFDQVIDLGATSV